jgi:hypothetical protein
LVEEMVASREAAVAVVMAGVEEAAVAEGTGEVRDLI